MSLTRVAVARPVGTVAAVAAALLLGVVTLPQLPLALLPELPVPVLTIRTRVPGTAASDVARTVAIPIEQALAGLPGLEALRTVSRTGEATTTVGLRWGIDLPRVVWMARERLDAARARLPPQAERPTLLLHDPGARPIAVLALTGPPDRPHAAGLEALARMAQTVYAPRLEQLAGIARVVVTGAPRRELTVTLDQDRLRVHGLTGAAIGAALRAQNLVGPGGLVRDGALRVPVHAATEFHEVKDLLDAPVGRPGRAVRLRDLGIVHLGQAEEDTQTRLDGRAAIGLVVYKDAGANTLAASARLDAELGRLQREVTGYEPAVVATQADFIRAALDNLGQEILLGAMLSLLLILAFLRDWRLATAVGLIVPLAVLTAVVLLRALDVGINVLSLGGLALGTGLLVDTAIVVSESIHRRREAGSPMPYAAIEGATDVAPPLLAGTLTTVLVFGPVVLIDGLAAALFRDLALSVVVTSLTSLLLALTLLPVMLAASAAAGARRTWPWGRLPWFRANSLVRWWGRRWPTAWSLAHWIERHEQAVSWSLEHPRPVLLMAVALLFGTGVLLVRLPREILPTVEDGVVIAQLTLPAGSTMDATTRAVARVERAAHALGVRQVHARVGVATDEEVLDGADPGSVATARLLLPVPPGRSGGTLVTALRRRVGDLVTAGVLTLDPGGHSEFASLFGRDVRAVRVLVHGPTDAVARVWADSVRHWLAALPDLTEVRLAHGAIQPVVALSLRRERLAMVGIEPTEVANALRGVLEAVPASAMHGTDEQTPIQIRGDTGDRTVTALLRQPVRGMPLAQLVTRALRREPVVVERVDQQAVQVVDAQVQTGDLAAATRQVDRVLAEHRGSPSPPAGVHWQVTGAEADRLRTSRQLRTVALVAAALVYLVLAAEFGSATIPGVVMLTVPLSIAGALVALWLTRQSLNAVSLIGIVLLIGMVDNEAVVKLDAIQRQQAAGWPLQEAIRRGSRERVRAILLAALTTIVGVLPLLGGTARGAALYRPLAATLIGGISMAWMVTSYLLPAVYAAVYAATEQRRLRP